MPKPPWEIKTEARKEDVVKDSKRSKKFSRVRTTLGAAVVLAASMGVEPSELFAASCEAPGVSPDAPRLESVVFLGENERGAFSWDVAWQAWGPRRLAAVDAPALGGRVRMMRCLPPGRWEVVGTGRVERLNGALAEATVTVEADSADPSPFGHAHERLPLRGNLYPRPMVGDVVVPVVAEVRQRPQLNPRVELNALELFDSSGEGLTASGREQLAEALARFAGASGRLLVEVHTRTPGNRVALRRASQLRADAVAQFAMRELGLASEQVVPVGFGSDSLENGFVEVPAWPARALSESVVLRILPAPTPSANRGGFGR